MQCDEASVQAGISSFLLTCFFKLQERLGVAVLRITSSKTLVGRVALNRHLYVGRHQRRSSTLIDVFPFSSALLLSVRRKGMYNLPCPTATPSKSSFGNVLCKSTLKPSKTDGKYGALKTNNPRKLSRTPGFLLAQIYTSEKLSGDPKNGIPVSGERAMRVTAEYKSSQAKSAVRPW